MRPVAGRRPARVSGCRRGPRQRPPGSFESIAAGLGLTKARLLLRQAGVGFPRRLDVGGPGRDSCQPQRTCSSGALLRLAALTGRDFFQALEAAPRCRARTAQRGRWSPAARPRSVSYRGSASRRPSRRCTRTSTTSCCSICASRCTAAGASSGSSAASRCSMRWIRSRHRASLRLPPDRGAVSGADPAEVDERIAQLGARGVGRVMRDITVCHLHPDCGYLPQHHTFAGT